MKNNFHTIGYQECIQSLTRLCGALNRNVGQYRLHYWCVLNDHPLYLVITTTGVLFIPLDDIIDHFRYIINRTNYPLEAFRVKAIADQFIRVV